MSHKKNHNMMLEAIPVLILACLSAVAATLTCPDGIFSFGDSLTDTGNYAAAFPSPPAPSSSFTSSKMQTYFSYDEIGAAYNGPRSQRLFTSSKAVYHPPNRAGDGRLVIDFVAQAFRFPFLAAYFQDVQQNYSKGVNFAFSSSTARDTPISVPFYLSKQVNQYIYFKNNVLYHAKGGDTSLPASSLFRNGLHWISIGINDFWQNYQNNNYSVDFVKFRVVPDAVKSIVRAVQSLYGYGARTFMIINVPALGCLPVFLSNFGTGIRKDYDAHGCLIKHNDAAKFYATMLNSAVKSLRLNFTDANILYGDYYQVHLDAVTNPTKFGLEVNGTLTACCGGGGMYKHAVLPCGVSTTPVCPDPESYISWDGLHFTESFNRVIAATFLLGNNVEPWPNSNMSAVCSLDFSEFYN